MAIILIKCVSVWLIRRWLNLILDYKQDVYLSYCTYLLISHELDLSSWTRSLKQVLLPPSVFFFIRNIMLYNSYVVLPSKLC
jgi:hypothetical protein